jgi:hypothetical protein
LEAQRPNQPPPREGVHVPASPVRCPFCHDGVDPLATDWVACKACLARHHTECWGEGGACGACGGGERLVVEQPESPSTPEPHHTADYWRERERLRTQQHERRAAEPGRRRPRRRRRDPGTLPYRQYLRLQGAWTIGAAIMAGTLHAGVGLLAVILGLISTMGLIVEIKRAKDSGEQGRVKAYTIASLVVTTLSFVATALTATSVDGPSGELALALFVLGVTASLLGRDPDRDG